jgi:GNAT superfamily N-acetyltransferase
VSVIILARKDHAAEMARLLTQLVQPVSADDILSRWDRWEEHGNAAILAVREDDSAAGLATLHINVVLHRPMPLGHITSLIVDEPDRRKGIGSTLVMAAEQLLANAGCGMIELTSNMRLDEAHAFYLRIGYEQTSFRFMKTL